MRLDEARAMIELLAMLVTDPRTGVLIALLLGAAVFDYRSFRIPNWLTASGLAFGMAWTILVPPLPGAGWSFPVGGVMTGFIAMFPMYMLRAVGAGDVKLMAMAGSFLGWHDTLFALLTSFVVGGVAAVAFAACHGMFGRLLDNTRQLLCHLALSAVGGQRPAMQLGAHQSAGKLAFGVSIAVATIGNVVARQLGFI
ncbi:A24 family peptidase [Massilia solisilvae]|uniref:A24 family peptidase n=1 Tax=Massilia solisilvae TaxID=1811225 RepID=A0ABT2BM01_9BURK|nr:A24 family peptidase [Massilia solisilvae]MCS0609502.1 A24 family peptidase [Massilia solisilvae]